MKNKKLYSYLNPFINEDSIIQTHQTHQSQQSHINNEDIVPINTIRKSNYSLHTAVNSNSFIMLIRTISKNIIIHGDMSDDFNKFLELINQLTYTEINAVRNIYIVHGENIKSNNKNFYETFIGFLQDSEMYEKIFFINQYQSLKTQYVGINGEIFFIPLSRL